MYNPYYGYGYGYGADATPSAPVAPLPLPMTVVTPPVVTPTPVTATPVLAVPPTPIVESTAPLATSVQPGLPVPPGVHHGMQYGIACIPVGFIPFDGTF
jgi:hypothetical protein